MFGVFGTAVAQIRHVLGAGEGDPHMNIPPKVVCPTCGKRAREAHRFRLGPGDAEDIGYCTNCSGYVTRKKGTGDCGWLSWTPICHRCGQHLTLDLRQSTESFHVYCCRDHASERRGHDLTHDAWYWLDSI
jgi:hypothetical protein